MDIYAVANRMKAEHKSIFDLDLRVTFYARVSTTKDAQENSIENQIAFFEDLIKRNKNWTYVPYYVDRIRGENAANREQFMKMIEDGKNGMFDLVLTKEVSRFARNTIDSLTYTRDLLRAGVGVFFQNDNICTIDTDSELRLTIMSSIAADEVRKLSERVKFGHKKAIENGHVLGNNRIYGYHYDNCKLTILEDEAEMVRLIFELYSTGKYSVKRIENVLFEKGYKSRTGSRIHHNTVTGIIRNPKYKGFFCGNKVKIVDYRTKEQRFLPESEWVMFKDETGGIVPAIVDEELWEKCNAIMRERSKIVKDKGRSIKNKSPYTGLIYCTVHDKAYWRTSYSNSLQKGHEIYQWLCSEKRRHGTAHCESFAIMESELDEIVADCINRFAENIDEYLNTFIEFCEPDNDNLKLKREITALEDKLFLQKEKKNKLFNLYTDDLITKNDFVEQNDRLNQKVIELEDELAALKRSQSAKLDYRSELENIHKMVKANCSGKVAPQSDIFMEMVKTVVKRIDVTPVDKEHMNLDIYLNSGETESCSIQSRQSNRRSAIIGKKIIAKQQYKYQRTDRRVHNHLRVSIYNVSICL